jgi:serine/threonine protein kinase
MPNDSALGPGMVLDGKYEILSRLGAGGMGEVFKARHVHLNTFRCIKVMRENLLADENIRNRFLREARMATQIHHSNIAVVHDFFLGDGGSYMVTEFIDGTTVRQWSAASGPFPLAVAADIAVQVLSGLDHIHRRGLLHRDISPDNVMITYDADDKLVAKIIDLGIAKDIANAVSADKTQAGVLIGNPKYMSPEQFGSLDDDEQLDGRADLYCLGIVLYEMLLGVPPFASETPQGYIMKHLTAQPRRFAEAKPGTVWSPAVEEIIFRALEKDRGKRFADAREFSEALQRFIVAPAGHLTRDTVMRLRRGPDKTEVTLRVPIESEDVAFQRAWESGQSNAWRAFLELYPDSERARELLEETLAFESACKAESETGLREFLKTWPEGRHHLEAEIRLVSLKQQLADDAFAQAVKADTYAALRDFLARFPASHADEAKQRAAERLAFETAAAAETEEEWEAYLGKYAADAHAPQARARLEQLHAAEEEAFARAAEERSAAAWDAFLAKFPHGKRNTRAEMSRREAIAFEQAKSGGRAALTEFARRHPSGVFTRDAQRLMRIAADSEDFAQAGAMNTPAAWQLYLATHPGGAHAAAARERLAGFEDTTYADVLASKNPKKAALFLTDFPETPRREELTRQMAKWRETAAMQEALDAVAADDLDRADQLVGQVPDPERRREITDAIDAARDRRVWEEAAKDETAKSLRAYLDARPNGRWKSEARRRLARRQSATFANEPADWNAAWETGTVAAWDQFLSDHPESSRIEEAMRWRQEAADFELAKANDMRAMWRAFLKTYPEGRHAMEAAIRLRTTLG